MIIIHPDNTQTYLCPGKPSEYLLCRQELKHWSTAIEVKFSLAIISSPRSWRCFSFFTRSISSGSSSQRFWCNIFDVPDMFYVKNVRNGMFKRTSKIHVQQQRGMWLKYDSKDSVQILLKFFFLFLITLFMPYSAFEWRRKAQYKYYSRQSRMIAFPDPFCWSCQIRLRNSIHHFRQSNVKGLLITRPHL